MQEEEERELNMQGYARVTLRSLSICASSFVQLLHIYNTHT